MSYSGASHWNLGPRCQYWICQALSSVTCLKNQPTVRHGGTPGVSELLSLSVSEGWYPWGFWGSILISLWMYRFRYVSKFMECLRGF